ncbi:MAG TPA: nucleotide-binding domain containing protein, partial [Bryobacteraceae bacterium]
ISGSSAPAMHLPSAWRERGWWRPAEQESLLPPFERSGRGILIASASCSEATCQQNAWLESRGCLTLTLHALELASVEQSWSSEVNKAISALQQGRTCLIKTSTDTYRVHRHFKQQNQTEIEIGERIVQSFATVIREIVNAFRPEGLILAGGETSSTISRVLELGALRIGPNIEPGVPVCLSIGQLAFPVVLKSGNFGSENFYGRAIDAIRGLSSPRA